MFSVAYATVRNREDALDLLQDACIKVIQSIGNLNDPERFGPWARNIVRNLSLDRIRRHERHRNKQEQIAAREAARPRDTGESARIHDAVLAAIEDLPEDYQAPLFCRYVQELSYEEIAIRTGRTTDSIRGLLYRGTRMLRTRLALLIERGEKKA